MIFEIFVVSALIYLVAKSFLTSKSMEVTPHKHTRKFLLDTSAIIDGRVFNITDVGIDKKSWIVSPAVIAELKSLADNKSERFNQQRKRAVKSLEYLSKLHVVDASLPSTVEVDEHLIEIASSNGYSIVTLDKNLIKQARAYDIPVLSPDELRMQALPRVFVGDFLSVEVLSKARKRGEAYAQTDWGEVALIKNGAKYVNKRVVASVTSVITDDNRRSITLER